MPYVTTNGIRLAYEQSGWGEPVLLIMGYSAAGRVWTLHQTPALTDAGYQAITFDNRGIPPSDVPPGRYSLDDMARDTRGLIENLGLAPCHVVGFSMGALITQRLLVRWPHLVRSAVLMATKARSDAARRAHALAHRALASSGAQLPAEYRAAMSVFQMLSPASLNNESVATRWVEAFQVPGSGQAAAGQSWADNTADLREPLSKVPTPCRVIAFSDDLIAPPHLGAEAASAIPDCDFIEIPSCGHLGYLERPVETNAAIVEFLDKH